MSPLRLRERRRLHRSLLDRCHLRGGLLSLGACGFIVMWGHVHGFSSSVERTRLSAFLTSDSQNVKNRKPTPKIKGGGQERPPHPDSGDSYTPQVVFLLAVRFRYRIQGET